MAVRVSATGPQAKAGSLATPRLYVINFDHNSDHDRQQAIRHRRLVRRVRRAISAAIWAATSVVLLIFVLVGIAGLR